MLILNMWWLVVTLVFSGSMFTYADDSGSDSDSNAEDEYMESTYYYSSSVGLFVGLLVAANTLMHLRCLRTAQLLVAELVNAGVDRQPAPVVMLATANPASAV
ncbi:hypothetical protein L917_12143 [Phytophthora nicotianae]|nr:hypothetical protein L917_12143 [Phytophthora nicotianae]